MTMRPPAAAAAVAVPHSPISTPTLYTSSDVKCNAALSTALIHLVNHAFSTSHSSTAGSTAKWDLGIPRFADTRELHAMLSDERSVVAVLFDDGDAEPHGSGNGSGNTREDSSLSPRKPIACAAAVPWTGGWRRPATSSSSSSSPPERGWELKTVCVLAEPAYTRRGLAVQLLACLETHLVAVERAAGGEIRTIQKQQQQQQQRSKGEKEDEDEEGIVALWIQAVECLNGVYWRKRGFRDIRRSVEGAGTWGCEEGAFEIVVLRRDVRFTVDGEGEREREREHRA